MNPSDHCNSRTQAAPTDARLALLAWLRGCPPAELRKALAGLTFKQLQQLHELHDFDPPMDDRASLALSQEARTAVLAQRCARGVSLWHSGDLIHRAELHRDAMARVGRVVSRRRNGSLAVGSLQRVDYTPPAEVDQWEILAAELAADQAATRAAHQAQGERHESDRTIASGETPAREAGNVDPG